MNVSKFRLSKNSVITSLTRSCVFYAAVLGLALALDCSAQASEPIRLTLDGELVIEPGFVPPLEPPLEEVLGLGSGDPFSLIFEFDSSILVAPGLPGQPQSGVLDLDRLAVQIGGLNFEADPLDFFGGEITVFENGNSGIDFFSTIPLGGILQTTQSDIRLAAVTAVPILIDFQTADIGVNGLGRFPSDLSGSDIASFTSGSLGLFQAGSGEPSSNILSINLTDVTVSAIPEPSLGALMLFSLTAMATRRRRYLSR
jgi:hypothetical protein